MTHLQGQSEVQAAGMVTWALPTAAGGQRTFSAPAHGTTVNPGVQAITPGYFDAMQIPSRGGRSFTDGDRAGTTPVAIVNEELARRLWPGRSPVGEFMRLGPLDESAPMATVVGVVGNIRRSLMHDTTIARVYLPFAQYPNASMQVIVRGRQGTSTLPLVLSRSLREIDATLFAE